MKVFHKKLLIFIMVYKFKLEFLMHFVQSQLQKSSGVFIFMHWLGLLN
jgi:hypothetical protein